MTEAAAARQQRQPLGWEGLVRAWALRPLSLAALGLAAGLLAGRELPCQGALAWASAAAAGVAVLAALRRRREARVRQGLLLLGLAAGLARIQPLAARWDGPGLVAQAAVRLCARVAADEGVRVDSGLRRLRLEQARWQPLDGGSWTPLDGQLRANVEALASQGWDCGDSVELAGDLRPLEGPRGPGQMDLRAWLLGRGVTAQFVARPGWPLKKLAAGSRWDPRRWGAAWRAWLQKGLAAGLDAHDAGLAGGILFGDKAGVGREDAADFARAGFADVLVLSGTHFALALALFLLLAGRLTRWRRRLAWLGLAFGTAYALASGLEAPVLRAYCLLSVWLGARALDLECEAVSSLSAGALLVLLLQPGAWWEAGFQLSFGCCLALLVLGPAVAARLPQAWPRWLRRLLGAQAALQAALLPLLAFQFHLLSWPGLLGGLLAVLAIAVALALGLPLAVLGGRLPGAGALLGGLLHAWLVGLEAWARGLAHWPGGVFSAGAPGAWLPWAFAAWSLGFLVYAGPWRRGLLGAAGAGLLLALLWPGLAWAHRHGGETRLWMLDVGQGDSLLLEFGDGRSLLVDAGPARPDAGTFAVLPALRALGIQRLDWVLATHADADHVGGLASVLDQMTCGELLWNGQASGEPRWQQALDAAQQHSIPRRSLRADRRDPRDGPWAVLNPQAPRRRQRAARRPDTNAASVVLRVEDWLLLTGDLPRSREKALLRGGLAPVEVLKVAHHGSRSATSPAWAAALRPREALISCGARNPFGHPSALALTALAAQGSQLWRTDMQGCVALRHAATGAVVLRPWCSAPAPALAQPRLKRPSPWRGREAPGAPHDGPDKAGDLL